MAVLRNPNRGKFTVVDNYALQDKSLSLKARGLLVTMLSLPDNWQFSENGLCSIFQKDGQASIRSGLKELEEGGYLTRKRARDSFGRVSNVEWIVCDYPHLENPSVVNPNLDFRPQLNTKQSNTEIIKELMNMPPISPNGDIPPKGGMTAPKNQKKRFVPPSVDEVRAYCQERGNHIDPQRFVDFYTANGWTQGRGKPIKDWRAAVRTWEGRDTGRTTGGNTKPVLADEDYDLERYLG